MPSIGAGNRAVRLPPFPARSLTFLSLGPHAVQPLACFAGRIDDLNRGAFEIKERRKLAREAVRRGPRSRYDRRERDWFLSKVDTRLLDGVDHFAREGVELGVRKVDELIVVVHAIPYTRRDICREICNGHNARADRVNLPSSMVNRIREWHAAAMEVSEWLRAQSISPIQP